MTKRFGELQPRILLHAYLSNVLVALTLNQMVNSCAISAKFLCVVIYMVTLPSRRHGIIGDCFQLFRKASEMVECFG